MLRIFGKNGKRSLDRIVMNETFENTPISSPRDIWNLYEKYMERASNILGDDVGGVIEFENLRQMESMFCTKCPLYEKGMNRSESGSEKELSESTS